MSLVLLSNRHRKTDVICLRITVKSLTLRVPIKHFIQNPKCESIGVLHTTRDICAEIDLAVIDDNEPFDGHSSIVFDAKLTNRQIEKTAKKLTKLAWDCGWDYYAGSYME